MRATPPGDANSGRSDCSTMPSCCRVTRTPEDAEAAEAEVAEEVEEEVAAAGPGRLTMR